MKGPERRVPRVNRVYLTSYVNSEGPEQKTPVLLGRTIDISTSGVGMEVYQEVAAGSAMELEIDIPDSLVAITGTVVHVRHVEENTYQIGIEFDVPQERLSGLQ